MPTFAFPGTVVRWLDGDTVQVDLDLGRSLRCTDRDLGFEVWVRDRRLIHRTTLRVLALDAPERDQPGHDEAWAEAQRLAPVGSSVQVTTVKAPAGPDTFTRYLASLTLPDGRDLAKEMRALGWADFKPGMHRRVTTI